MAAILIAMCATNITFAISSFCDRSRVPKVCYTCVIVSFHVGDKSNYLSYAKLVRR